MMDEMSLAIPTEDEFELSFSASAQPKFAYSGDMSDPKAASKIFNIANSPDKAMSSMLGRTIKIKDLYVDIVETVDKETGELKRMKRYIAIDPDGVSYNSSSTGIIQSIERLVAFHGSPTWEPAIEVEVCQKEVKNGRMFVLKEVTE